MRVRGARRVAAWVALTAGLLSVASVAVPPSASAVATPSAADLGISVEVGFGRETSSATWNLVEVRASPPVPLSGRLEVRSTGALGIRTADERFEVSAGATRVVHLLLPPSEELTVAFVGDDGERVRIRDGFTEGEVAARVGALGQAPALPSPLNTIGTDRPIRGVAVDPAVLALGPRALDALDALLIGTADLGALPDDRRRDLEVAVANGLELVVHVRPGDGPLALSWNPVTAVVAEGSTARIEPTTDAWSLTPDEIGLVGDDPIAASVRAGNGRVTATVAAPGDGGAGDTRELWSSLVQLRARAPQPLAVLDQGGDLGGMLFGGGPSLPGLVPFAVFALAFVVLVGPVNGLVLRRLGRRELGWVTVPAITILFTAIALGATSGRAPVDVPVVRAAWWLDGVGQEVTVASVQSPARGTTEIRLPGARDGVAGGRWSQIPSTLERNSEETTVQVRLETLQLASVVAWGSPDRAPPLEVEATVDDGLLAVSMTNRTDVPIEDVEVSFATSSDRVGRLEPGGSVNVEMDELGDELALPRNVGGGMRMAAELGMGRDRSGDAGDADPGPGVARTLLAWDQLSGRPGDVWVTGSTPSDLGLAVPRLEGTVDDRGTFVAVGVTPRHLGGRVLPQQVARNVLRTTAWPTWQAGPLELEGGDETVLRYQFPGPAVDGDLHSTLALGQDLGQPGMAVDDPFGPGCFAVSTIDPQGAVADPEEVCGDDVACPADSIECGGSGQEVTACFPDGRCQTAVRTGDLDGEAAPMPPGGSGLEVYDHGVSTWIPLEQAFPDGRAPGDRLVSPRGDVLVRVRGGGYLDLGRRGLGVVNGDDGGRA